MIEPAEILRSVEVVWALWLGSIVALVVGLRRVVAGLGREGLRGLAAGEEGAAYSLSYVMAMPVLALLIALVVESTLILVVKMGTVYAAFAAARSQVVWLSAEPNVAREKAELAAAQAMAPFASSDPQHARGGASGAGPYVTAYRRYAQGGRAGERYLGAKYALARAATRVAIEADTGRPDGDITATVEYEVPLHIPGIGRILGERSAGRYYTRTIRSRATLQNEAPVTESGTLGIRYVSQ